MNYAEFERLLVAAFPFATPIQKERFARLEELYRTWNGRINVISRKDIDNLYEHHVLHSLAIARFLQTEEEPVFRQWQEGGVKVLDLGTGGGFPGIPLAILFPSVQFTLCDSIAKKTLVASSVAGELGLENVIVENARAESLKGPFDHVVSRAVASLDDFYPWVRGRFTGSILYLKGGDLGEEIDRTMGRFHLPGSSVRTWKVDSWLSDSWFEGKMVVRIRK